MKILKEHPFSYEFDCRRCGSQLVAAAEDVKVGYFGAMGDYDREYYVTCPVCSTDHTLGYRVITPKVRELADRTDPRNRR